MGRCPDGHFHKLLTSGTVPLSHRAAIDRHRTNTHHRHAHTSASEPSPPCEH